MECIEIKVRKDTAEKWRSASPEKKARIRERVEMELAADSTLKAKDEFQQFLDEIRRKVKKRGLTEEKLQEILSDDE